MRSQEFTGKTTQEAIDAGLAAFGVTIADVHVDVLQEGAKGLFGLFGSKPARVRMTVMEVLTLLIVIFAALAYIDHKKK